MKKLIVISLISILLLGTTCTAFANPGHWAEIPLKYMTDNGYLQGGNPDDAITRLDVARAISKLPLIDKSSNYIFADTSDKDVIRVAKAGIMNGYGNQLFNPNAYITREEMAKVLAILISNPASYSEIVFSDRDSISGWAMPYVSALTSEQIILGYDDSTFRAQNNISRAEFASLFMKIRDKYSTSSITGNAFANASVEPISFLAIPDGHVGLLSIPLLGLNDLPVVEDGENLDNIETKVGHFLHTALFDGNVCLLGHNNHDKSPWFGRLDGIQEGATIRWQTKFGVREYVVTTKQYIDAEDWSSLFETGDNRITLITCLAGQAQTHRIMVQGIEK